MTDPYPTIEESATAVVKAVAARRARRAATALTTAVELSSIDG